MAKLGDGTAPEDWNHGWADRAEQGLTVAVTLLEGDPGTGKQLRGRLTGLWSLRIGSYRIIYEVRDAGRSVRVVAVLHREIAYRRDPR